MQHLFTWGDHTMSWYVEDYGATVYGITSKTQNGTQKINFLNSKINWDRWEVSMEKNIVQKEKKINFNKNWDSNIEKT